MCPPRTDNRRKVLSKERSRETLSAHSRLSDHPHVNPVLEVVVGPTRTCLVFPPARADLHAHVRSRRRLPEHEARPLVAQIARTLAAAHRAGLVLRDLKLRKFLFTDHNRTEVKLESLEDAVVLSDPEDDWLDVKHGCPAYVSPEILSPGGRYCGRAADCWSLGVLTYAMLVGRYPFHDPHHAGLFTKIRHGAFTIPDSLSPRARCLIRSLLRRDASERLSAQDVLAHPWFHEPLPNPDPTDQCVPSI
ncbi:TRIB2 [Cordylochernes scorpioides]|uniref:TRIB2 n=1 Tax=Cordylochernes scorpioides TaxID=51811 RepID=A0ABY6JUV0_9ARAC|nr:TRIB2 [Cordylochernes scorpioides]